MADMIIKSRRHSIGYFVLIVFGIMIVLISLSNSFRTLYLPLLNRDITLTILASRESEEVALDDNVRVSSIAVNGRDINLGVVEIPDDSGFEYDSQEDFLYSYDSGMGVLSIPLKGVHNLNVTCVTEWGSGYVTLYLDGKQWSGGSLYSDTDWGYISFDYQTNPMAFPEKSPLMLLCFFLVSVGIGVVIYYLSWNVEKIGRWARHVIINFALALLLFLITAAIQFQEAGKVLEYLEVQSQLALVTVTLIFLFIETVYLISGRHWVAFLPIGLLCLISGIVSHVKLDNTGVPLLPWDVTEMMEALSVVGGYEIRITSTDIFMIIITVCMIILLFTVDKTFKGRARAAIRIPLAVPTLAVAAFLFYYGFITGDAEHNSSQYRVYQVGNYYEIRGFLPAFMEYMGYLGAPDAPAGYSKEYMASLLPYNSDDGAESASAADSVERECLPNIIVVLNESFWDASRIDTIEINGELLPCFEKLKGESIYGDVFTHVLNGNTVVSEFELLTGFSGVFFPDAYMVYGSFIDDGFDTVVSMVESQGYRTMAFHPYLKTNYNRDNAYKKFGFDQVFFEEDFEGAELIRNYVSDAALYEKVIEEMNKAESASDQPVFAFVLTMQNHGGYWESTIYSEGWVDYSTDTYGDVAFLCVEDMLAGLHEADRALGDLIDYFREVEKETLIVFVGDHISDAGPNDDRVLEQTSWAQESETYDYEVHQVPFIIWNNMADISHNAGMIEMGQLLPLAFDQNGIHMNAFWEMVLGINDFYAATDSMIIVEKDGSFRNIAFMTREQNEARETYRAFQYDYIWGSRFAEAMWD